MAVPGTVKYEKDGSRQAGNTLVVNEVYGPVWQGEGPSAGQFASVVRLMGCNLACRWQKPDGTVSACDEAQTWDASRYDLRRQANRTETAEIARRALACFPHLVIITGGEPLLHQRQPGFGELAGRLHHAGAAVEVETNGTQAPAGWWTPLIRRWNVSPKLSSSGTGHLTAANPAALEWFAGDRRAVFKFVCTSCADVDEVAGVWMPRYGLPPARVWIMPAGTAAAGILDTARDIAPSVLHYRLNLTLRQHVLVYDATGEPRDRRT
jgi:organic radical activating enzyme